MNTTITSQNPAALLGTDTLNSPLATSTDHDKKRIIYTPFGYAHEPSVRAAGFTGQMKEPVGERYLLGNGYRAYSPSLMRFMAADELSPFDQGGINSYAYCENQPITRTDPDGRFFLAAISTIAMLGGIASVVAGIAVRDQDKSDSALSLGLMIGGGALTLAGFGGIGVMGMRKASALSGDVNINTIKKAIKPLPNERARAYIYELESRSYKNFLSPTKRSGRADAYDQEFATYTRTKMEAKAYSKHLALMNQLT
ncbi:RHS repeat-associated core domain-containing protein [Pseudomonas sp. RIT-PI-S]|uniref:RHS repeat-associated core domain-containing protein n=1 Tax=Pseudomonas sp. RIT-PI-S TaxID=3035295 RepID=UPI0021D8256C|nr:RHS repeat-associated core domain-containing protein [Pseudomonas sp. RIT-PI-S]